MFKTIPEWKNAPAAANYVLKLDNGFYVWSVDNPETFVITTDACTTTYKVVKSYPRTNTTTIVQCGRGEGSRFEIAGEYTRAEIITFLVEDGVIDKVAKNQPKPILVTWRKEPFDTNDTTQEDRETLVVD